MTQPQYLDVFCGALTEALTPWGRRPDPLGMRVGSAIGAPPDEQRCGMTRLERRVVRRR
jgi:hypothetical protein